MGTTLVTGVTGTVGRHVTRALLRAGHSVIGVALDQQHPEPHERLTYHQVEITDSSAIRDLMTRQSVDTLVHLAALVHVRDSRLGFPDYCRLNFRASENLFQLAKNSGVRRIIFASTTEVYGPTSNNQLVNECAICRPDSDYARSKLLAEEALTAVATESTLSYAVLRLAPVYASGFRLNLDKRIYLRAPTVGYYLSSGDYRLSLCSVHNIEHFVTRWLELAPARSGVFNLADENAYSIKQLLDAERRKGRCTVTLRLPFAPCLVAIALVEAALSIAGRQSQMLTVGNIRKLVRSAAWDTSRATAAVGHLPWNMDNTLANRAPTVEQI
jgi:nucleoside-diphosphate-sugar epimerase